MGDDPVPRNNEGRKHNRNFITNSLLKATNVVGTQSRDVSEYYLDNNPKRTYTSGIINIPFSKSKKEYIFFSDNFIHVEKFSIDQQGLPCQKFTHLVSIVRQYCCAIFRFRFNVKNFHKTLSLRAWQDFLCG